MVALFLFAGPGLAAPAGDAAKGAALFTDHCAMCHGGEGQGPDLKGVVGRKAGTAPGFAYSSAMTASGLSWTPDNLDKFLAGPGKAVPGTAMLVSVPDPAERADIIAYLATLKP